VVLLCHGLGGRALQAEREKDEDEDDAMNASDCFALP
jgi:hypothetical protein